jgi:hypothetical protein
MRALAEACRPRYNRPSTEELPVPKDRRLLTCVVTVIALLIGATSALAKTQGAHPTRISGVVVGINAKRHTLKLHVAHTAKHRVAAARAASAGGSSTIVVVFGDAKVSGPDGAVSVGDDVTVTTNGPAGPTTVASSIAVIGRANGGDSGKGAAVPGTVAAIDPTAGTLTLAVTSTDAQGQSVSGSVIVTFSAATILAVGDTNGDGQITLADVSIGDHVVVFTEDATVDPIAAVGILDSSHVGGDHLGGGDPPSALPTPIPGTVKAVDPTALTLSVEVNDGPLAGQTITVDATSRTSFGGASGSGAPFGLADIKVNDSVVAYTRNPTAKPVVAVGIVDRSATGGDPSATVVYDTFNGTVAGKGTTSLQVTVTGDGPLAGQTVTVNVNSDTRFKGTTTDGTAFTLGDVAVGDQVRVYTATLDPQALLAVAIGDGPTGSGGSSPTSPPSSPPSAATQPQRFGAVVTAVRGDGLTVTVLSSGSLKGQSVVVSVPATTSFQPDPATGAGKTLATVSVGDAVEIYTDSETGSPIVAVGVTDDGVYPNG